VVELKRAKSPGWADLPLQAVRSSSAAVLAVARTSEVSGSRRMESRVWVDEAG
jgi:hypothetical protein